MEYKKGDKLYCHIDCVRNEGYSNMIKFKRNNYYNIYDIEERKYSPESGITTYIVLKGETDEKVYIYPYNIKKYFYTMKEIRKLKLNVLDGI